MGESSILQGYLKTKFQEQIFNFQVYGNLVEENIMYQQLQKICREKVCHMKVCGANVGKFGKNILCTLKELPGGSSPAGSQWCRTPHLKSVPPHLTFGAPGCCIHPILYF